MRNKSKNFRQDILKSYSPLKMPERYKIHASIISQNKNSICDSSDPHKQKIKTLVDKINECQIELKRRETHSTDMRKLLIHKNVVCLNNPINLENTMNSSKIGKPVFDQYQLPLVKQKIFYSKKYTVENLAENSLDLGKFQEITIIKGVPERINYSRNRQGYQQKRSCTAKTINTEKSTMQNSFVKKDNKNNASLMLEKAKKWQKLAVEKGKTANIILMNKCIFLSCLNEKVFLEIKKTMGDYKSESKMVPIKKKNIRNNYRNNSFY